MGPFPCGDWNDFSIFRFCLEELLEEGERVEADDGYSGGDPKKVKTPAGIRYLDSTRKQEARGLARARHETVNNLLTNFAILHKTFHHDIELHGMCFRFCAILLQLSLQLGTKNLFDVARAYSDMSGPV